MSKIIIYPNNTIEIDGVNTVWSESDFAQHDIPMFRNGIHHTNNDTCQHIQKNGNEYIIFYSIHRPSQKKKLTNPFKSQIIRRKNETCNSD